MICLVSLSAIAAGIIIVMMAAKSGTRKILATDQNVPGGSTLILVDCILTVSDHCNDHPSRHVTSIPPIFFADNHEERGSHDATSVCIVITSSRCDTYEYLETVSHHESLFETLTLITEQRLKL